MAEAPPARNPVDQTPRLLETTIVTSDEIHQVQIARWQVWEQLAAALPDGHLLSIELLHSRPGDMVSVFTFVRQHHAIQSVVGTPEITEHRTASSAASPEGIALGEPPPKEPPLPGLVALAGSLRVLAFGGSLAAEPPSHPSTTQRVCCSPDEVRAAMATRSNDSSAAKSTAVTRDQVTAVRVARWHAWRQLARALPDGHVLSAELLHSSVDPPLAVLTLVKRGEPVQYVVASDRRALTPSGSDRPASPNTVAMGEPPIKEPPHPGVIDLGTSLLAAAFGEGQ